MLKKGSQKDLTEEPYEIISSSNSDEDERDVQEKDAQIENDHDEGSHEQTENEDKKSNKPIGLTKQSSFSQKSFSQKSYGNQSSSSFIEVKGSSSNKQSFNNTTINNNAQQETPQKGIENEFFLHEENIIKNHFKNDEVEFNQKGSIKQSPKSNPKAITSNYYFYDSKSIMHSQSEVDVNNNELQFQEYDLKLELSHLCINDLALLQLDYEAFSVITNQQMWVRQEQNYLGNEKLKILQYSSQLRLIEDMQQIDCAIHLLLSGEVSERVIPLIHDFEKLQGIYIYADERLSQKLIEEKYSKQFQKIKIISSNQDETFSSFSQSVINFYYKQSWRFKEIEQLLGKQVPISSYFMKAPLNLMNAHYLLNHKYQQQNEFFILKEFKELKTEGYDLNIYGEILKEAYTYVTENNILFPKNLLSDQSITEISKKFNEAVNQISDSQISKALIMLYREYGTFFQLINIVLKICNEAMINILKVFIQSLRLAILLYNENNNSQIQTNYGKNKKQSQGKEELKKSNLVMYKGIPYDHQYFEKNFEIGERIAFPVFINAHSSESKAKEEAESMCGQKQVILQINYRQGLNSKNLVSLIDSEKYKPKNLSNLQNWNSQQNQDNYQPDYIINCFSLMMVEDKVENYDGGYLFLKLAILS